MPDFSVSETITHLTSAQNLDNARAAGDRLKLPATLRSDLNSDLTDLLTKEQATAPSEGGRAGASAAQRGALDQLKREHDGGYRFIQGLDEATITPGQRLQAFVSYGWTSGEIGDWTDARIISLARLAPTISAAEAGNAAWLYPSARLARIAAQLAIVDATEAQATGGDSQAATLARETARGLAETTLFRIRCFYCSATRDADQTPELVKIGYQPRRDPGTAGGGEPTLPGTAVLNDPAAFGPDGVELTFSAADATGFDIYQQQPGGTLDLIEEDFQGTTRTVTGLTSGTHSFQVAGRNADGVGPRSEVKEFTL